MRAALLPRLRRTLDDHHLSLQRATFGTWTVVVQQLASAFRDELHSDRPDAVARLRQLFADPGGDALDRLLSSVVGTLVGQANLLRNRWHAHAPTTSEAQVRVQVEELARLTEELRDALAGVWEEYQLIRAGKMAHRVGRYDVDVELAIGPSAPFRKDSLRLVEPLEHGRLYLVAREGELALPLIQLIIFRSAPRTEQPTCYFYSKREPGGLRFVAYQYADENSVLQQGLDIEDLLAATSLPDTQLDDS